MKNRHGDGYCVDDDRFAGAAERLRAAFRVENLTRLSVSPTLKHH